MHQMTSADLRAKLLQLARELRGEADRWLGRHEREALMSASAQTYQAALGAAQWDLRIGEAFLDAGTDVLVKYMAARAYVTYGKGQVA